MVCVQCIYPFVFKIFELIKFLKGPCGRSSQYSQIHAVFNPYMHDCTHAWLHSPMIVPMHDSIPISHTASQDMQPMQYCLIFAWVSTVDYNLYRCSLTVLIVCSIMTINFDIIIVSTGLLTHDKYNIVWMKVGVVNSGISIIHITFIHITHCNYQNPQKWNMSVINEKGNEFSVLSDFENWCQAVDSLNTMPGCWCFQGTRDPSMYCVHTHHSLWWVTFSDQATFICKEEQT